MPRESAHIFVVTLLLTIGLARAADVAIPFTIPSDGRVSLAVYNKDGQLVRTLLTGVPRKAGSYTESWDGRDRYGNPLRAGEYSWKLVTSEGLRSEFITQVGHNGIPRWEKGCSTDGPARSAAIDATGVYRMGQFNELGRFFVKTDFDGRYLYAHNDFAKADPWMNFGDALTVVKRRVFARLFDGTVNAYDAQTGHCLTDSDSTPKPWNMRWDGDARSARYSVNMDMAGDPVENLLVLSYRDHGGIQWFDATTGKRVDQATGIAAPTGIAVGEDGAVSVISEGAVWRLTRQHKTPQLVIAAKDLQNPWRLTIDRGSGAIHVAENSDLAGNARQALRDKKFTPEGTVLSPGLDGTFVTVDGGARNEPHHQVKRFSRDGRLLQVYGAPAGRKDGLYVATDFKHITDIEADPEGGFLVTEGDHTPPRRSARFDKDGRLLREWLGGQSNAALAAPEPDNPRFVWMHANAPMPGLLRCEVDYDKRSWRILETYHDVFKQTGLPGPSDMVRTAHVGGRLYIFGETSSPIALTTYDPAERRVRLVCRSGWAYKDRKWLLPEALRPADGSQPAAYLWTDLNDDGVASREEMQWLPHAIGGAVDEKDLTIYTGGAATGYHPGNILTPVGFTPGGTPKYVVDRAGKYPAWEENGERYHLWDMRRDDAGNIYGCFSDGFPGFENHGAWFFNSCAGIDRLLKWDRNWKPLWSVGRHSPDDDHDPGSTAAPRCLVGITHGCVIWSDASDAEVAQPTVWTEDGLYVDELMRQPGEPSYELIYGEQNQREYPHNNLYTDPKTGDVVYFAVNNGGGSPIYRLSGWESIRRQSGTLTLSTPAAAPARNGSGLTAQYFNTPDLSGEAVLTRLEKELYNDGEMPGSVVSPAFSARWSGQLEAPVTDEYRIVIEGNKPWKEGKDPAWSRLWVDGRLLLDTATGRSIATTSGHYGRIRLTAGRKVDLVLECGFKQGKPAVHLCWETAANERRRIQQQFLYPKCVVPIEEITRSVLPGEPEPPRPFLLAHFRLCRKPHGVLAAE